MLRMDAVSLIKKTIHLIVRRWRIDSKLRIVGDGLIKGFDATNQRGRGLLPFAEENLFIDGDIPLETGRLVVEARKAVKSFNYNQNALPLTNQGIHLVQKLHTLSNFSR